MNLWIHWIRPQAFWLLLLLIPLIWLGRRMRCSEVRWSHFVDPHLLPYLLVESSSVSAIWWPILLALGWILFVITLAGPSWHQIPTPVLKKEQALVVVLDNSLMMLAQDIQPSRIARAKYKLVDLLKARKEGQTALIVFSAEPYVVTPLTQDTQTLMNLLPAISPDLMPKSGQSVGLALSEAAQLIHQTGSAGGEILLITGGFSENNSVQNQLGDLKAQGIKTSIYGIGTARGSPISLQQGGFLKDDQGNIQMAHLDASYLKMLANAGGGAFVIMTLNDEDIQSLNRVLESSRSWSDKSKESGQEMRLWQDQGHWVILCLLPILLLLFFRRGVSTGFSRFSE